MHGKSAPDEWAFARMPRREENAMRAERVFTRSVVGVQEMCDPRNAAAMMHKYHVGALLVTGDGPQESAGLHGLAAQFASAAALLGTERVREVARFEAMRAAAWKSPFSPGRRTGDEGAFPKVSLHSPTYPALSTGNPPESTRGTAFARPLALDLVFFS